MTGAVRLLFIHSFVRRMKSPEILENATSTCRGALCRRSESKGLPLDVRKHTLLQERKETETTSPSQEAPRSAEKPSAKKQKMKKDLRCHKKYKIPQELQSDLKTRSPTLISLDLHEQIDARQRTVPFVGKKLLLHAAQHIRAGGRPSALCVLIFLVVSPPVSARKWNGNQQSSELVLLAHLNLSATPLSAVSRYYLLYSFLVSAPRATYINFADRTSTRYTMATKTLTLILVF